MLNGATGLATVDLIMAGLLLLSMVVGVWRGLVREVMALAGWVVAYVGAQALAEPLAPSLPIGAPAGVVNLAATFALVFVAVLFAWALLTRLLSAVIKATPLSAIDRLLGAAFGLARGVVVLLVVTTVLAMTPLAQSGPWQRSQGSHVLGGLLHGIKPLMPTAIQRLMPA
jgi:membrane protein required for colicin V production